MYVCLSVMKSQLVKTVNNDYKQLLAKCKPSVASLILTFHQVSLHVLYIV